VAFYYLPVLGCVPISLLFRLCLFKEFVYFADVMGLLDFIAGLCARYVLFVSVPLRLLDIDFLRLDMFGAPPFNSFSKSIVVLFP